MFIGSFPGTHDKENVQQHSLAGILALVAKLSTVGSLQPHTLTSFAPGLEPVCGNTMPLKAGYYDPEEWYGNFRGQVCKRTSYNNNIRGIYAGIGYSYNSDEDIFISPQPFASWIRSGSLWNPPTPMPTDGKTYEWDEGTANWIEVQ
jgi:hypothetical protein